MEKHDWIIEINERCYGDKGKNKTFMLHGKSLNETKDIMKQKAASWVDFNMHERRDSCEIYEINGGNLWCGVKMRDKLIYEIMAVWCDDYSHCINFPELIAEDKDENIL